jgi:uncharacterized tellurite resistance protein B-like protein
VSTTTIDFTSIPEGDRKAFYAALFSIAVADGSIDKEELHLVFESMILEGMSQASQKEVYGYIIEPPQLSYSLERLAHADDLLRFGIMINLVDVAWADDILTAEEEEAIALAQKKLRITDEQMQEIGGFIKKTKRIHERGLDDNYAADTMKGAVAGLTSVGIPIAAVYFSGSVVGLSAAGITSGLAALGIGGVLGLSSMVTGIGIAVVIGAGAYMGINKLLDTGGKRKKEKLRKEQERKAQMVIQNLQATINTLLAKINDLMTDTDANREAIHTLNERLKKLQGLLQSRKRTLQEAAG